MNLKYFKIAKYLNVKELILWYNRIETGITWGSFKKRSEVGAEILV